MLIVEDEFLIRMVLADALGEAGYEVDEAADADEAVALAARATPAVVVTDIQMPGTLDGPGLARVLRQTHPELKILFTSGRGDPESQVGRLGPNDAFIAKPYTPSRVIDAVRDLLTKT